MNKVWSLWLCLYSKETISFVNFSNHALGDYFSPYRAFFRRCTLSLPLEFQILEESPFTLLLKLCKERYSLHPSGVSSNQNELLEQETLKLHSSLLLEQMFPHSSITVSISLCNQSDFIFVYCPICLIFHCKYPLHSIALLSLGLWTTSYVEFLFITFISSHMAWVQCSLFTAS